jgi:hypothetical protein
MNSHIYTKKQNRQNYTVTILWDCFRCVPSNVQEIQKHSKYIYGQGLFFVQNFGNTNWSESILR